MNVQSESPVQRSPWFDELGAEMRTVSGTSTPYSPERLSPIASQGSAPSVARPLSRDSLDTLCDPLAHFGQTPPPYASFMAPMPVRGLYRHPSPQPLRRQQPSEHAPLMAGLQQSQQAARAPVTRYTSNVTSEIEQRRRALSRIDARKALIRAALLGLEDNRWNDHVQYNLIKEYLSDIDERFGAEHSVRLANGLHLSRHGFCLEADLTNGQGTHLFFQTLEPNHTVFVTPSSAAQNAGCLRMVHKRRLLEIFDRAVLGALLEGLPAELQLERGRMYRPGSVLAATAAVWALQVLCCLPMVPVCLLSDDLNRSADDKRSSEEDFQFWQTALAAENRAPTSARPYAEDLQMYGH